MEIHHKVLSLKDLSDALEESPKVPSGPQTAEDKQGGREASQEPSGVTRGRALGAGPGGAGKCGEGSGSG